MENASKALIIAGEILIGILVLSLASYMIVLFGNYSRHVNDEISQTQIDSFNVRYTNFSGRANISMQEVVSIINYSKRHNADYEAEPGDQYYVDVKINNSSVLGDSFDINDYLTDNKNSTYYQCNVEISHINGDSSTGTVTVKRTFKDTDIVYNDDTKMISSINFTPIDDETYVNAILQNETILFENG